MTALRDLKTRITSIESTKKITSAMYMVSAAKFRRYQRKLEYIEKYIEGLLPMLSALPLEHSEIHDEQAKRQTKIFIVMTGEKGLCGSFNTNIIRHVVRRVNNDLSKGINITIFAMGKKGYDFIQKHYPDNLHPASSQFLHTQTLTYGDGVKLFQEVKSAFEGTIGHTIVEVIYNKYISPISQVVDYQKVYPLVQFINDSPQLKDISSRGPIDFFPQGEAFVSSFTPQFLQGVLWHYIQQTQTGEFASRMTAMDNATKNSQEMIQKLRLTYNQMRQDKITRELMEVISGAEALEKE